jgi:hypothetical protein
MASAVMEQEDAVHTPGALLALHERGHRNLAALLIHCRELTANEINQELADFGYQMVRLQLHHVIGTEKCWMGVLGRGTEHCPSDDNLGQQ